MRKPSIWLMLVFVLLLLLAGCSKDDSTNTNNNDNNDEPQEFYYESDVDNSYIDTLSVEDTVSVTSLTTTTGDSLVSGDTVDTRVITISGVIPDISSLRTKDGTDSTIVLHAEGGSCMDPGPWNASDTFTIYGMPQTITLSYQHYGVMCTGDYGYQVVIKDISDSVFFMRDLNQGLGIDIDTTWGTLTLVPGTYVVDVSTVTGTDTYVRLTYNTSDGSSEIIRGTLVVYHNGNLYPISEADPDANYTYSLDLVRGDNIIRVLIISNFDPAAQIDIANILGASEVINLTCLTDEIAIRAVLTWEINNSDVDLHFIAPGGRVWSTEDCFYSNMNPNWGDETSTADDPMLDIDNTSGYGPETMVIPEPVDGIYAVVVHYFYDHGGGDAPATVVITLNEDNQRTYGPKSLTNEQYWVVTGINVVDGVAEFTSAPDSSYLFDESPTLSRTIPRKRR